MLGIREYTQRFDFCQCHFKVKVIFQGQMTAWRATIRLGITPTLLIGTRYIFRILGQGRVLRSWDQGQGHTNKT